MSCTTGTLMKHVSEILPAIVKPEMKPLSSIQQRLATSRQSMA
jgi:hypothetical protein